MACVVFHRVPSGCSLPAPVSASVVASRASPYVLLSRSTKSSRVSKITWKCAQKSRVLCVRMGIRAVESYDASFQLLPECDERLRASLNSEAFCAQVTQQANKGPDVQYEFTGEIFQPVPWSPTTKHGMPQEFEKYLDDKEQYAIINVPPNFMFQAKIFKPSRLCAIYKRVANDQ